MTTRAIKQVLKFISPTIAQFKAFPVLLSNSHDVLYQAPTGSGKSLVYLASQIELALPLAAQDRIACLVLVPNRELGEQVHTLTNKLLTYHQLKSTALLGGVKSRNEDIECLNRDKPEIVIATPGRLAHHIEKTAYFADTLKNMQSFVIDEADFIMSQGIDHQLDLILKCLPKNKRTTLVSATITEDIKRLSSKLFRPHFLHVDCGNSVDHLKQAVVVCHGENIMTALYSLVTTHQKTVVFFPTAQTATFAFRIFKEKLKVSVRLLHGKLAVSDRVRELKRFTTEIKSVLFTTDLAARGIDFHHVNLILQVHVPINIEQYIHRVGRTARAGPTGEAILLISKEEKAFISQIIQHTPSLTVSEFNPSQISHTFKLATQSWAISDPDLLAEAADTRRSLVGYFEAGPARTYRIACSRLIAENFIKSAGYQ